VGSVGFDLVGLTDGLADVDDNCKQTRRWFHGDSTGALKYSRCTHREMPTALRLNRAKCVACLIQCQSCQLKRDRTDTAPVS